MAASFIPTMETHGTILTSWQETHMSMLCLVTDLRTVISWAQNQMPNSLNLENIFKAHYLIILGFSFFVGQVAFSRIYLL